MACPSGSAWERFLAFSLETPPADFATYSDSLRGCALSLYLRSCHSLSVESCGGCTFQEVYTPRISRLIHLCTRCLKTEYLSGDAWVEMSLERFSGELDDLCAKCADRVPRTEAERLFKEKICLKSRL